MELLLCASGKAGIWSPLCLTLQPIVRNIYKNTASDYLARILAYWKMHMTGLSGDLISSIITPLAPCWATLPWFSTLKAHTNDLLIWLKANFSFRISGWGLRFCIFDRPPDEVLVNPGITLRIAKDLRSFQAPILTLSSSFSSNLSAFTLKELLKHLSKRRVTRGTWVA